MLAVACGKLRGAALPTFSLLAPIGIVFIGLAFSPIRGHMYSLLFAAWLLCLLERDRRGDRRWIAAWLILFPVWVNLHAGFVVGIGFLGIYCLEQSFAREPVAHLAGLIAAMVLMIGLNPFGASYYGYLWRALRMKRPAIGEWRPVWEAFPSVYSIAFLGSLLLVAYAVAVLGRKASPGIGLIAVSAAAAAMHRRMLPFYALVFVCYVPAFADQTPLGRRMRESFQRWLLAYQTVWLAVSMFFLLLAIGFHPWQLRVPGDAKPDEIAYPVGAVDYLLNAGFAGNIMTPFSCGAYVSWRMYPRARVSMDSRYEAAYPDWLADESFRFYEARPGWQTILRSYPTDIVLVRNTDALWRLIGGTGWKRVYADRAFELYARIGLGLPPVDHSGQVFDGRFP